MLQSRPVWKSKAYLRLYFVTSRALQVTALHSFKLSSVWYTYCRSTTNLCIQVLTQWHAAQLNSKQNYFNGRFQEVVYQLKWRFSGTVFTEKDSLMQYINSVWTDKSLLLSRHRTDSCHHCRLLLQALKTFSNPDGGYANLKYSISFYIFTFMQHINYLSCKKIIIVAKRTPNFTLILIIYVIQLKYTYSFFYFLEELLSAKCRPTVISF